AVAAVPEQAAASPFVRYGIQDDAWLEYGPGTLDARVGELKELGADVVRVTLNWRQIEPRKGVDSWARSDALLRSLHAHGVSPLAWIAGMKNAHARLDAYAHNPYPLRRGETPMSGGCGHCTTITMATLPRLLTDVLRAFGTRTRIWLTEYGYQTNPPDRLLG